MAEKYSHYVMFGAESPPACADKEGLLKWRDGFEKLPEKSWTKQERWIHAAEKSVELQAMLKAIAEKYRQEKKRRQEAGPAGAVRIGGFKKPESRGHGRQKAQD